MTNEELTRLLPLAARAMGYTSFTQPYDDSLYIEHAGESFLWCPNKDAKQCAEMNAALMHTTCWYCDNTVQVSIQSLERTQHDGTTQGKVRAWREASVRAAARVGEQMEQEEVK